MIAKEVTKMHMFPFICPNPFDILSSQDTPLPETDPDDHFSVSLDMKLFKREEITVQFVNSNTISVEAEHDEQPDGEESAYTRHLVRNYEVPGGYEIQKVLSKLSREGILTITAPKIAHAHQEEIYVPEHVNVEKPVDEDNFVVSIDMHHFKPDEIDVKFISKHIISVEAQHKPDGRPHRRFVQKFVVPVGYDADKVMTKLSDDGIISITGPRISIEKDVPVVETESNDNEETNEKEESSIK